MLLVSPDNRVLLIRVEDPRIDEPSLWITPGGGCEPGETPIEAAQRELLEETGLTSLVEEPLIGTRQHAWRFGDRWIDSESHFFAARLSAKASISYSNASADERSMFQEHRWWSVDELRHATDEVFAPRNIVELILPLMVDSLSTP